MIDELRSTLDRHATQITARPDPYARLIQRRRDRRQRTTVAAGVLVLMVMVSTVWMMKGPSPASVNVPGQPPAAVAPLLNSPTRGSLAADLDLADRVRQRAAHEVNANRGYPLKGPQMPVDPAMIKVLFAGDIGARRVVVVAGMDEWPLKAVFDGAVGDSADDLTHSGSSQLEAVVDTGFSTNGVLPRTYLLLGPTGAVYETAQSTYSSTGVQRTWSAVASPEDYVGIADLGHRQRFRVRIGDSVLHEADAGEPDDIGPVMVDPQPVAGRGTPIPDAAQQAADSLARQTGLTGQDVTYRVLWSDEVDMAGTAGGRAYVVTVQAVTSDGGGPYATAAFDTAEGMYRDHPTGYGLAGDPASALIVMRLPHYLEKPDDRLQIIAPPSAVRAEVTVDGQSTVVALVDGVGQTRIPLDSAITIRAYGAEGAVLATAQFSDLDNFQCDRFDPPSCSPKAVPEPAPTE